MDIFLCRFHSAREARLNQRSGVTGVGAWCPSTQTKDEYLEIDLGQTTQIHRVATQGIRHITRSYFR